MMNLLTRIAIAIWISVGYGVTMTIIQKTTGLFKMGTAENTIVYILYLLGMIFFMAGGLKGKIKNE